MPEPDKHPPVQDGQPDQAGQADRADQADLPGQNATQKQPKETIQVEVAFAKPEVQVIVPLKVPPATTAAEAIQRSELAARFAELEPLTYKYGIFGKVCKPDQTLREGDRIEIYRPLIADPKQVRKDRAAKGKKTRKGAKAIGKEPATASSKAAGDQAPADATDTEPAKK